MRARCWRFLTAGQAGHTHGLSDAQRASGQELANEIGRYHPLPDVCVLSPQVSDSLERLYGIF